jgi:excisionase family DNA binding protein
VDEYLTVSDAAEAIGITARALRWRIQRGDVRADRVNPRLWLVPRSEVERLQEHGKLKPWQARKQREAE